METDVSHDVERTPGGNELCKCKQLDVSRKGKFIPSNWETVKRIIMFEESRKIDKHVSLEAAVLEAEQWMAEESSKNPFMENLETKCGRRDERSRV
jgi:predicted NAD-dependent protein-ADP-ribosyltransferase YbiA (DUF1768 family)